MYFVQIIGVQCYVFNDFKMLLVKVSLVCFGDYFVGLVVVSEGECMVVCMVLVDVLLLVFFNEVLVLYEDDEVMCLIFDCYDVQVFQLIVLFIVGEFCNWLFLQEIDSVILVSVVVGIMLEMVVVVSKLMCNQDLIFVVCKCCVVIWFCNIIGLLGWLLVWLQFNYLMDDFKGIVVLIIDGLLYGCGDVIIGINFVGDNFGVIVLLL